MIRHNSPRRDQALEELRKIVDESINNKDTQLSRSKMFNWTKKHLPPNEWNNAKSFWRKLL